ncbi:hypothetical protein MP228_008707 [Amoeboaphelidium protococcarum]|nr:hypothetical protein MP228_008707 [Amoeboaphelidium protococcarum]
MQPTPNRYPVYGDKQMQPVAFTQQLQFRDLYHQQPAMFGSSSQSTASNYSLASSNEQHRGGINVISDGVHYLEPLPRMPLYGIDLSSSQQQYSQPGSLIFNNNSALTNSSSCLAYDAMNPQFVAAPIATSQSQNLQLAPPKMPLPNHAEVGGNQQLKRKLLPPSPANTYDEPDGHYRIIQNDYLTPRFKIVKLLGQGTYGKVVEALDKDTQGRVAIKIIKAIPKYREAAKMELKILEFLKRHDQRSDKYCIQMLNWFDYRDHYCMVFPLLGLSVYDFMKLNKYNGYPLVNIRDFARQLFTAVSYLHELGIVHTDLKPENVLLQCSDYREVERVVYGSKVSSYASNTNRPRRAAALKGLQAQSESVKVKVVLRSDIKLIDFGSAIYDHDRHSTTVQTRHYRAPEVILKLGWSFPCDIWSIGCILGEMLCGEAMFQTHDDLEHLKIMEILLGPLDGKLVCQSLQKNEQVQKEGWFVVAEQKSNDIHVGGGGGEASVEHKFRVNYPKRGLKQEAKKYLTSLRPLEQIVLSYSNCLTVSQLVKSTNGSAQAKKNALKNDQMPQTDERYPAMVSLLDLLNGCLCYDPEKRLTASDALRHSFFTVAIPADTYIDIKQ